MVNRVQDELEKARRFFATATPDRLSQVYRRIQEAFRNDLGRDVVQASWTPEEKLLANDLLARWPFLKAYEQAALINATAEALAGPAPAVDITRPRPPTPLREIPTIPVRTFPELLQYAFSDACRLKGVNWRENVANWVAGCINIDLGVPMFRTRYANVPLGRGDCALGICFGGGRGSGQWFGEVPLEDLAALREGRMNYQTVLQRYAPERMVSLTPRRFTSVRPGRVA